MISSIDYSRFHGVVSEDVLVQLVRTVDVAWRESDLDFPATTFNGGRNGL